MSSPSRLAVPRARVLTLASLIGLLSLAACREPTRSAEGSTPQDSVVLALPTLALTVEVTPATIALGDTATVRATLVNRSTTPVTVTLSCWPTLGYVIETPAGDLAPWVSQTLCLPAITPIRFGAGEVRVVEFRLPRPEREPDAVLPGEYRVRATFGTLRSAPARLVITNGG